MVEDTKQEALSPTSHSIHMGPWFFQLNDDGTFKRKKEKFWEIAIAIKQRGPSDSTE